MEESVFIYKEGTRGISRGDKVVLAPHSRSAIYQKGVSKKTNLTETKFGIIYKIRWWQKVYYWLLKREI